jgi:hypothetical protein
VPQRYLPSGQNSDNTISSLSWAPWCINNILTITINMRRLNTHMYHWILRNNNYRLMHALFHIKTVIIPRAISLVSVWEINFVLFNSMLKYVINRLMHAFFHIRTFIIPRAKALWPISGSRDVKYWNTINLILTLNKTEKTAHLS